MDKKCPFDDPKYYIEVNVPCPVCGDYGTGYDANGVSNCPKGFTDKENDKD